MAISNPLKNVTNPLKFIPVFSASTISSPSTSLTSTSTSAPRSNSSLEFHHRPLPKQYKIIIKSLREQRKKDAAFDREQERQQRYMQKLKEKVRRKFVNAGMTEWVVDSHGLHLRGMLEDEGDEPWGSPGELAVEEVENVGEVMEREGGR